MFKIRTINNISVQGLERFPRERYEVASEIQHPDAILVRSQNLHEMVIPETLRAVGRAGAGVNNIPIARLSKQGIAVFNAPGANANAVKELIIGALLLGCRHLCEAWDFARRLEGSDAEISKAVEGGKKGFAGFELRGRTLGVIGLGAVGVQVANAAGGLGMRVVGFDPSITVERAWQLSTSVVKAHSVEEVLEQADFLTLHVPLVDATRALINRDRLQLLRPDAVILNFSRREIVDEEAVIEALEDEGLHRYICDFPSNRLRGHPKIITLPHLGASTREAEDNCAVMVADQIRDYLENGNVVNSVNFPEVVMPHTVGYRISVVNANVPNMLGQISTHLAQAGLNILDMLNRSRGEIAYTLVDVESEVPIETLRTISGIDGVLAVRAIDTQG